MLMMIAAWLPGLALWFAFGLTNGHVPVGTAFVEAALTIAVAAVLGLPIWEVCVRLPWLKTNRVRFFATHFGAATVYSYLWMAGTTMANPIYTHKPPNWSLLLSPRAIPFALTGIWLYAAVAGFCYTIIAQQLAREQERRALRAETWLSTARLDALRHRLHPHFLFNALHTVAALVREDSTLAENAIEKLGDILRYSLQEDAGNTVPFADEWEFTRRYLDFEQLRHGERLRVVTSIDPRCMDCNAPLFALQTLVENAVHHSVATRPGGGNIEITAKLVDSMLFIQVRDDGTSATSSPNGAQFGLAALRERLQAIYGNRANLSIASDSSGFQVAFMIPRIESEDVDDE
jgi:hypothetical protein